MIRLLLSWVLRIASSGVVDRVLQTVDKKTDAATERERLTAQVSRDLIQAETAQLQARKEMGIASMNHPVWWIGWFLFVLPVGIYNAAIFLVSAFGLPLVVQRVPAVQEAWANEIIGSIFLAQIGASGLHLITRRWLR